MKINITGRHLAITDAARSQIEKRIGRVDRLLHDSVVSAQCTVSRERGAYLFDVTIHARGDHMLHALARSTRLTTAVSIAADKVGQQAQKLADRWKSRRRTPAAVRSGRAPGRAGRSAPAIEPGA